jgi:hypothetical protein
MHVPVLRYVWNVIDCTHSKSLLDVHKKGIGHPSLYSYRRKYHCVPRSSVPGESYRKGWHLFLLEPESSCNQLDMRVEDDSTCCVLRCEAPMSRRRLLCLCPKVSCRGPHLLLLVLSHNENSLYTCSTLLKSHCTFTTFTLSHTPSLRPGARC